MDQRIFIAQLNIEHFRRRLADSPDGARRRLLEELLAEEEAKLSSLTASVAEGILAQLLDHLGSWTSGLLTDADTRVQLRTAELSTIFSEMPCGMSLIDGGGKVVLSNEAMRRFVSDEIPSRDPQRVQRWRLFGSDGQALDPTLWPGARALRGESVNPGLAALHISDDGRETALRIAAVPVTKPDGSIWGAIGAAYELSALERQEVHDLLERMLVDEQSHSRRGREGSSASSTATPANGKAPAAS